MTEARLRKHADYQRVYREGRKHFSASLTYFYAPRSSPPAPGPCVPGLLVKGPLVRGPRIGITAGRVLGKAVERNRIKRRMREAIRLSLSHLTRDVDVVLHPRRAVLTASFSILRQEVAAIFSAIERPGSLQPPNRRREASR